MIGFILFFSYVIGKLVNGFIVDYVNVVCYMSFGLLFSVGMNLMMGMIINVLLLVIFWGINGWVQLMGVGFCVVLLVCWYGVKECGIFYGIWLMVYNIGEVVIYMVIVVVIVGFGWQMGYLFIVVFGVVGVVLLVLFMYDLLQSSGFLFINVICDELQEEVEVCGLVFKNQLLVLCNLVLWIFVFVFVFMYIDCYVVNFWGIFFLEQDKVYFILEVFGIIGVNVIVGIVGIIIVGMFFDCFFLCNCSVMVGFISLLNIVGFVLMFWLLYNYYIDILVMIIFGVIIGVLICFFGGLIVVDIFLCKVVGVVFGIIGIVSYVGVGLGEFFIGIIIDKMVIFENGKMLYDFSMLVLFWVGIGLGFVLFCFIIVVIVVWCYVVEWQILFFL